MDFYSQYQRLWWTVLSVDVYVESLQGVAVAVEDSVLSSKVNWHQ